MTCSDLWFHARVDIARAAALAILVILLWCSIEDRWTITSWQTPIDYLTDVDKSDVLSDLAGIRAARDGHVLPLHFINVPELGAPGIANWDDYPASEKLLFLTAGLLAWPLGIFAAANVMVLLGHVLSAVSFYTACRLVKASWIWAFAGGVTFALSRFQFSHGLHHITISYLWHVPLCLVVFEWLIRGDGLRMGERRFIFALVVAFITGVQNVYYTYIFLQFVGFAALYQIWTKGWRAAWPAAAVIACTIVSFFLMISDSIAYHAVYGPNPGAVMRLYSWVELYALKLVDLIVPPPDHAFPPFAAWGQHHLAEIYLPPGEFPSSGYIGLLGLAATAWLVSVSWKRAASRLVLPLEALMILWIFLYGTVGGFNGLLGAMGFQLFRATTRYSIVILCLVLMFAVRRLSEIHFRNRAVPWVLAAVIVFVAWLDQTPQVSDQEVNELADQVNSDRTFTQEMERRLPPGSMILQLPLMDYPESAAPGVPPYDHFRPYLYSVNLRYSFGTDKGRPSAQWQHQLSTTSLKDLLAQLDGAGFRGVYVNRNGFKDKGEGIVNAFKSAGLTDIINSPRGDLFCVILKKP